MASLEIEHKIFEKKMAMPLVRNNIYQTYVPFDGAE